MDAKYSVKSVIIILFILLGTVAIDTGFKVNIENSARIQAKYNLSQIKLCVNTLLLKDSDGLLTRYNQKPDAKIREALYTCAKNMKVSINGDVWAYDLHSKHYVFDSNQKYGSIVNRYWEKDKICGKKEWCKKLLTIMASGYDSTWIGYSWIFKKDKEYLEWKVLPEENLGFNGISVTGKGKPQQIVVVQGAREKELMKRYTWLRTLIYSIGFIMIIGHLLLEVGRIKYGRRKDDS